VIFVFFCFATGVLSTWENRTDHDGEKNFLRLYQL
jgi:hypothetical protein